MGQLGFFDVRQRYESLDAKKRSIGFHRDDVPWESFRSNLMAALIKGSRHAARCLWLPRPPFRTGRRQVWPKFCFLSFASRTAF